MSEVYKSITVEKVKNGYIITDYNTNEVYVAYKIKDFSFETTVATVLTDMFEPKETLAGT